MDLREAAWWLLLTTHHFAGAGKLPAPMNEVFRVSRLPSPPFTAKRLAAGLEQKGLLDVDHDGRIDLTADGQALCETIVGLDEVQRNTLKRLASLSPTAMLVGDWRMGHTFKPLLECELAILNRGGNLQPTDDGRVVQKVLEALTTTPFSDDFGPIAVAQNPPAPPMTLANTVPSLSKQGALEGLLLELFDADEFRSLLRQLPDSEPLLMGLPNGDVTTMRVIAAGVALLERHGLIDESFFTRLVNLRPRKLSKIGVVAALW